MADDEREITRRERAYALILGAIVLAQLEPDVELAWRVADMATQSDPDRDDDT